MMKVRNPTFSGTKKSDKVKQRRIERRIAKSNVNNRRSMWI